MRIASLLVAYELNVPWLTREGEKLLPGRPIARHANVRLCRSRGATIAGSSKPWSAVTSHLKATAAQLPAVDLPPPLGSRRPSWTECRRTSRHKTKGNLRSRRSCRRDSPRGMPGEEPQYRECPPVATINVKETEMKI